MSPLDLIEERLARHGDRPALVWGDRIVSHSALRDAVQAARGRLTSAGVSPGSVVALSGDFSPAAIAWQLALYSHGSVVVPLRREDAAHHAERLSIAEVEWIADVDADDSVALRVTGVRPQSPLTRQLTGYRQPGLIMFSSGTSGAPKAALHDVTRLLAKFSTRRRASRMLAFLLFDHIGGINTMLHALLDGGCLVTVTARDPYSVAAAIERHRVEMLPTSPTFLNLCLLARIDERYDLSSLRLITYGTEPMSEATLETLRERLPHVKLHQTYGMTELGILVSKSRSSGSLWLRLDSPGCDCRVRDGMLEIRTATAMLGYLNAPSPITEDGWLVTGDAVERDGDWIRVLGRRSELINVGGQKVVPAAVEAVLEGIEGVEEAVVEAEPSPLTGQIVRATVRLASEEPLPEFRKRMRRHCRDRLPRHMIPQKVVHDDRPLHTERYKKRRATSDVGAQAP